MPLEEKVSSVLSGVFGVAAPEIPPNARMGELEGWDSLGHILLMGELERTFGVSFTINEAADLESLEGIVACLRRRRVAE